MRRPSCCSAARMSWNRRRPVCLEVAASGEQLRLDVLEGEIGRVDLAMRVRVADADDFALVLEDEDERHVGMRREFTHLLLPRLEQGIHAIDVELRQRHVVPRAVADDARHTGCRTVPVDAGRGRQCARRGRRRRTDGRCRTRTCRCSGGFTAPLTRALPGQR